MLLTIPTELQTHVCSYLPRSDLASVVRVSQHLHAVAVGMLYEHVQLHSFDQVQRFFLIVTLLPQGSPAALQHADAKRAEWERIKTLEMDVLPGYFDRFPPTVDGLPRSLRGNGVKPLALDRLRVTYQDDPMGLVPLLQCFSPLEVCLRRTPFCHVNDPMFDRWTAETGWKDVTSLVLAFDFSIGHSWLHSSNLPQSVTATTAFAQVTSVTLVSRGSFARVAETVVLGQVEKLVSICPKLEGIMLVSRIVRGFDHCEPSRNMAKGRMAGKPASFYKIKSVPAVADVWGDAEKDV